MVSGAVSLLSMVLVSSTVNSDKSSTPNKSKIARAPVAPLQRAACGLLYYVAAGGEQGRLAVVNTEAVDAIVTAMRDHPLQLGVQADGCGALCTLASVDDTICFASVLEAGAVDAMVEAMKVCRDSAEVQRWGCVALCSIAAEGVSSRAVTSRDCQPP